MFRKLIDQRTFSRSRSAGQPDNARFAGVWKKRFKQLRRSGRTVLDRRDDTGQRQRFAGAQSLNRLLWLRIQTVSVKHRALSRGSRSDPEA
jgi:hypothetical protein